MRHQRIVPLAPYRKTHVTVPRGRPPKDRHRKQYCRRRWRVERAFRWLNNRRRLNRRLEHGQKAYRVFMRAFFLQRDRKALFFLRQLHRLHLSSSVHFRCSSLEGRLILCHVYRSAHPHQVITAWPRRETLHPRSRSSLSGGVVIDDYDSFAGSRPLTSA